MGGDMDEKRPPCDPACPPHPHPQLHCRNMSEMAPVWGAGLARRVRGDTSGALQPLPLGRVKSWQPGGSCRRRKEAQRLWQGLRKAGGTPQDPLAILHQPRTWFQFQSGLPLHP